MSPFNFLVDLGAAKEQLSASLQISHAMLHVHAGLAVWALATLLLRVRLGSVWPLAIIWTLELTNEALDALRYYLSDWPWTPDATIEDIVNTVLWPTVLTLVLRRVRANAPEPEAECD